MASMDKATIIFGERKLITPMNFTVAHMNELETIIQAEIGYDFKLKRGAVGKAVDDARKDPLLKTGYVKVGVVLGNLVMRFKEKNTSGKHMTDLILVKDYKAKKEAHAANPTKPPVAVQGAKQQPGYDWDKLSVGNMNEEGAKKALASADDGTWLVRHGLGNALTVTVKIGDHEFKHYSVAEAEALNLSADKRLGGQGRSPARLSHTRETELERMDGFFRRLDRAEAERLLSDKDNGAWLVRGTGRTGEIIWSRKNRHKVEHAVINDDERYAALMSYRRQYANLQVVP
jgi:hypothetical protein